jgi:cytochrome c oxidase cbb3-type subunit 1
MTETSQVLRGRFTGVDLDQLVDERVVRTWLYWGMFWLIVTPSVGVTISGLFNYPDYLGTTHLGLTFGRLRPIHVNGVIFGAFSSLFIGECYYLVPRLCGVRVVWGRLGVLAAWVWNVALLAGLISLAFGSNHGLEAGELPLLAEIPIFIVTATATAQFLITIGRRLEPQLYVALWYLIGAFVWTTMNLILGSYILPYTISSINSAAFHGLYIHYIDTVIRMRPYWLVRTLSGVSMDVGMTLLVINLMMTAHGC